MNHETELTIEDMKKDLQGWGIGLIVIGGISIALRNFLNPVWGVLLIIVGIITLACPGRGMFIVLGLMLLFVGVMNMLGGGGWLVFGLLQIYWGVMELIKYGKYADVDRGY